MVIQTLFLPLTQGQATPITSAEKEAVIQRVGEILRTKAIISVNFPNDALYKIWEEFWYSDKYDPLWGAFKHRLSITTDREKFHVSLGYLMEALNGHLSLGEAKEELKDFLKSIASMMGFEFKEKEDTPSPYQEYEVTAGCWQGHTFRFPPKNEELAPTMAVITKAPKGEELLPGCPMKSLLKWHFTFYKDDSDAKRITYEFDPHQLLPHLEDTQPQQESTLKEPILQDDLLILSSLEDDQYNKNKVEETMRSLILNEKTPNLIIDLRGNLGGTVVNMEHFLSFFLPLNTRYRECITRKGKKIPCYIEEPSHIPQPKFSGKLAILIDMNTASASEIAAHTLRAFLRKEGRVVIIGQRSRGITAVVRQLKLSDTVVSGFHIIYPSYATLLADPENPDQLTEDLEGTGITPDIEVVDPQNTEECLQRAREWFENPRNYPIFRSRPPSPEELLQNIPENVILITPYHAITRLDRIVPGRHIDESRVGEVMLYPNSRLRLIRFDRNHYPYTGSPLY
jgi:hypothetical protein